MNPVITFVLLVLSLPALIAVASIWRGYVLSILWGWFVVPYFALTPLSIPLAIGLSILVSMLISHRTGKEVEKEMGPWQSITIGLMLVTLGPAFYLLAGWIVTKFL